MLNCPLPWMSHFLGGILTLCLFLLVGGVSFFGLGCDAEVTGRRIGRWTEAVNIAAAELMGGARGAVPTPSPFLVTREWRWWQE